MSTIKNIVRTTATLVTLGIAATSSITPAHADHYWDEQHFTGDRPSYLADNLQGTFFPKSDILFVASGQAYPDAIAGAPLFGRSSNPLYLTDNEAGSVGHWSRLKSMGVKHVVILGGHAAVSKWVESDIKEAKSDVTTERIAGIDRYETAALAAKKAYPSSETVILASGQNFPDALTVGPAASKAQMPVLLSDPKALPNFTLNALRSHGAKNVIVIGGTAAVSEDVVSELKSEGFATVRISGNDRFLTAIEVAKEFFPSSPDAMLASGESFQAALTVSAPAAKTQRPLLLKRANCTPKTLLQYIEDAQIKRFVTATIGGTRPSAHTSC